MSEYEIKPRRPTLERVLSRISIPSMNVTVGNGTTAPTLTASEYAGMVAGIKGRAEPAIADLAEQMAWAYLEHDSARRAVVLLLNGWSKCRFMDRYPEISMTGSQHGIVVEVLVDRHLYNKYRLAMEMRRAMRIGEKRWPSLAPWVSDLQNRMNVADQALAEHLQRQLWG